MDARDGWTCAVCGVACTEVTRLLCTTCLEHHEVCLDYAPDVEVDGRTVRVREALALLGARLGTATSTERLLIASTGEISLRHDSSTIA
jgi:hypothetical protein